MFRFTCSVKQASNYFDWMKRSLLTIAILFQSAIAKLATDSMFKLQHDGIDRGKGKEAAPTIGKIVKIQGKY